MRPHLKTVSSLGCKAESDATGHESLCVLKKKKKKMPLATSYSHLQDVKSCDSTKRHFAVRDKKEKKNYNHSFIYFLFIYLTLASRELTPVGFGKQNKKKKKRSNPTLSATS